MENSALSSSISKVSNAAVENSIRQLTHRSRHALMATRCAPSPRNHPKGMGSATSRTMSKKSPRDPGNLESEENVPATPPAKTTKAKTTYKPRIPNYLHDLDITGSSGGVTFKDFAIKKNPSTNAQRHLVAAYWLKEYGNSPTINMDKVFTCYRTADWPTNQPDWDVGFRAQVKTNRFRRVASGEYAINPVGEDDVRKMDGTG